MDTCITSFEGKAHNENKLIEYLYQHAIISISDLGQSLAISKPTANFLVKDFEAMQLGASRLR